MSYKQSLYVTGTLGSESSPNSASPSAARIFTSPSANDGKQSSGNACMLAVQDGTSLVVTLWFYDAASALWVQLNSALTVSAGTPAYVMVPDKAQLFAQLGTNTGSVTKFSAGFVSGSAQPEGAMVNAVSVSSSALPTGASTSALQSTLNTSVASLDTKQPALGTAVMTGSSPVTIASNDTVLTGMSAKFQAAAVPADAEANTGTMSRIGSFLSGFNGTTWDRLRTAVVAKTATFTGLLNAIVLGRYNTTPATLTDGDVQLLQLTSKGSLRALLDDGTNAAAIKAASTAGAFTDPAMTVEIRPGGTVALALTPAAFSTPAAVTGTGSAVALSSATSVKGVWVQADYTNTTNLRVGDSSVTTTRGIQLAQGERIFIECTNASAVYLIAESGSPKANIMVN